MAFFKVRDGVTLGMSGKDVAGGEVIELPDHFQAELIGRADLCDAEGTVIPLETATVKSATDAPEFGARPAHERVSLLEQERDRLQESLTKIEAAIERAQADAEKPREPAPEVDMGVTRSYSEGAAHETLPRQPVVSGTGNVAPENDPNRGTTPGTPPGPATTPGPSNVDFKSQ